MAASRSWTRSPRPRPTPLLPSEAQKAGRVLKTPCRPQNLQPKRLLQRIQFELQLDLLAGGHGELLLLGLVAGAHHRDPMLARLEPQPVAGPLQIDRGAHEAAVEVDR